MQLTHLLGSAVVALSALASAHPGEHEEQNEFAEMQKREFKMNARRGIESCAEKLERRGVNARAQVCVSLLWTST
jgi:hypothetical protein